LACHFLDFSLRARILGQTAPLAGRFSLESGIAPFRPDLAALDLLTRQSSFNRY
jgi:hypothetical protein